MNTKKLKKVLIKTVPYALVGLLCTNIGEAMRYSQGKDMSEKMLSFFTDGLGAAFANIIRRDGDKQCGPYHDGRHASVLSLCNVREERTAA